MSKMITKVIGLAVIATVFTTSLAAQDVAETQKVSVEVEPGLMNFRYIHYVSDELYLNEQFHEVFNDAGEVFVHPLEEGGKATFTVDTISKGRYLLALDNPKSVLPEIKRYLFCFAHPDMEIEFETPPTEEVLANSYFRGHIDLTWLHGCILSVEAVRVDNVLRVIGAMGFPIMDIDLTKANNFTFSFKQPEGDHYPDGAVVLNSELGGEIYVGNSDARLKVVTNSSPNVFLPEPIQGDDPSSNEPPAVSVEVEPGLMNFRLVHSRDDIYLVYNRDGIIAQTSEKATFSVDTISKGRYLLALNYEGGTNPDRKLYLFSFAHPDMGIEFEVPLTEDALDNSYLDGDMHQNGCILSVEAVRVGNTLQVGDFSMLVPIKEIDLTKANNFTFALNQPNYAESYPAGAVVINAEFGGSTFTDDRTARLKVRGKVPASIVQTVFMPEPLQGDDPNSNEPLATETAHAYAANGALTVQSPVAEEVSIYSANGTLYLQKRKGSGIATYDITTLPQGVLIVKGSSGWAKKVVND